MLRKRATPLLFCSLLLTVPVFEQAGLAADVETVGNLTVHGVVESASGGFKFPDGSMLTASGLNGLLFNVGFVVDDSASNTGNLNSGAIKFGSPSSGEGIASQRTSGTQQNGLDFYTNYASRLFIDKNGYVGIGTRAPAYMLDVAGPVRASGWGSFTDYSSNGTGVYATANTGSAARGVYGYSYTGFGVTGESASATGAGGRFNNSNTNGRALSAAVNNNEIMFVDASGVHINFNLQNNGDLSAWSGSINKGLVVDNGNSNNGVFNNGATTGNGLSFGLNSGEGIASKRTSGGNQYGLDFYTSYLRRMSISQGGRVAIGSDPNSNNTLTVNSISNTSYGIYVTNTNNAGTGIFAEADNGNASCAVWGRSTNGYAGFFDGKVLVSGNLIKPAGSFKIDHPLDPANKYLSHSFVESPDMMNIYNGNVTTGDRGYATVELPDWFEALNRDFRYQLTVIDETDGAEFVQAKVVHGVKGNRFTIRTSKPETKVSWQVTGIRHDAWADTHRIPLEEEKKDKEAGKYLHPELFGQPETMGVNYSMKK
jgi:hypothetical protein